MAVTVRGLKGAAYEIEYLRLHAEKARRGGRETEAAQANHYADRASECWRFATAEKTSRSHWLAACATAIRCGYHAIEGRL